MELRINVRADIVKVDPGTGIVTLAIEAVEMDHDLRKALDKNFPHCYAEVEAMCEKEAIISAITNEGSKELPAKR